MNNLKFSGLRFFPEGLRNGRVAGAEGSSEVPASVSCVPCSLIIGWVPKLKALSVTQTISSYRVVENGWMESDFS